MVTVIIIKAFLLSKMIYPSSVLITPPEVINEFRQTDRQTPTIYFLTGLEAISSNRLESSLLPERGTVTDILLHAVKTAPIVD